MSEGGDGGTNRTAKVRYKGDEKNWANAKRIKSQPVIKSLISFTNRTFRPIGRFESRRKNREFEDTFMKEMKSIKASAVQEDESRCATIQKEHDIER